MPFTCDPLSSSHLLCQSHPPSLVPGSLLLLGQGKWLKGPRQGKELGSYVCIMKIQDCGRGNKGEESRLGKNVGDRLGSWHLNGSGAAPGHQDLRD